MHVHQITNRTIVIFALVSRSCAETALICANVTFSLLEEFVPVMQVFKVVLLHTSRDYVRDI